MADVHEPPAKPEDDPPPLSLVETERIITRLANVVRDRQVVLIGGQAVALWATYLRDHLTDGPTVGQVVSGDIDFLGEAENVRLAGKLLDGKIQLSSWEDRTPLAGVAIFLDSDGYRRRLDFLESAYGMDSKDVRDTAIEVDLLLSDGRRVPLWVMHPERCMESRVHNSALPGKQTDLAWRQLRASIICARAFSQRLLDERGQAAIRDVLNLNERIFSFAQRDGCTRIARDTGIEIFDAILDDERLPERFRALRLPQMREQVRALRSRAASQP